MNHKPEVTGPMIELRTARLLLRPWAATDATSLVALANNWNIARNLQDIFPHPYTPEDASKWIGYNAALEGATRNFAIVSEDRAIGGVALIPQRDIWRCSMELGYWLGEPFWGRGYATEAVTAIVDYGFTTFPDIHAVRGHHMASNPATGSVLLKAGFTFEGRLRQAAIKAGVVTDMLVYSILRSDRATSAARGGA